MKTIVIAIDEFSRLFTTRRGALSLLAFALVWVGILLSAILPVADWLSASRTGEEAGILAVLLGPILESLRLSSLMEWSSPQLAIYRIVALTLLPPFAVLVAADQTASDLGRGTLRFHALRASRPTLFLGRFAGQLLVQLALVIATLASVLVVVALQTPEWLVDSLAAAPSVVFDLLLSIAPWLALMALCSALARSPRQATLFAVVAWIVVWIALSLARDVTGPLAVFEHILPGSAVDELRRSSGAFTPELAIAPLLQSLVLLGVGLLVFARRDL